MKASVVTVGCKLNEAESSYMRGYLIKKGYRIVNVEEKPDLCIINTCTVTHKADRSSTAIIRRLKRKLPDTRLVVTGCLLSTRYNVLKEIDGIEILPLDKKQKLFHELPFTLRKRLFLKAQDGCDRKCSYCIVSRIRKNLHSKPIEDIKKEIGYARENGYAEVVVVGLNLGLWGKDIGKDFVTLLKELSGIEYPRIRLSSIEPDLITQEVLKILSESFICKYLHIPIQHGDDEILERMGRRYKTKDIRDLFEKITKYLPEWNIGSDFIVGFPTESEKHFRNLVKTIEDSPISHIHVFSYSDRPGVPSSFLSPKVPPKVIKERNSIIRELGRRKSFEYRKRFKGKVLFSVQVDDKRVLTDNYIHVYVNSLNKERSIIPVKITKVFLHKTEGIVL